jgi:DNA-binding HxlR family transcriptional regulator
MTIYSKSKINDPLAIIGDYWTLRVLLALKECDDMRFCTVQRELDDLNPVTLTSRLKKLEEAGLIDRCEDVGSKLGVAYRLNKKGQRLLPLLMELENLSETLKSV